MPQIARAKNVTVVHVPPASSQALAKLAQRTMQLQCTIQDGQIWLTSADGAVQVETSVLREAGG